jgi:hypothetical protein
MACSQPQRGLGSVSQCRRWSSTGSVSTWSASSRSCS